MLHVLLTVSAVHGALCLAMLALNVAFLPRLSRGRAPAFGDDAPFLSIVVPARNEERAIAPAVASLLAQRYPSFEVIVVDDRSTDGTRRILRDLEADPRLSVVDGHEPPPGWLGKPHALHQGSLAARGELLLFVDADVRYHPDGAGQAVALLLDRQADFAALLPKIEAGSFWEKVLMPNLICAVFFAPAFLANLPRPRWWAAGGGAGNLIRRSAYQAIGGHEALKASVIDDVRLGITVKRAGFRALTVRAEDRIAVRMYHGFREVWDGFTKNTAFAFGGWAAAPVALLCLLWGMVAILPPAILVASLAGAAIPAADLRLAVLATALTLLARAGTAAVLSDPIWPALTNPLMAAVWLALLSRSLYQRLVRRSVVWRGRSFDAKKAEF